MFQSFLFQSFCPTITLHNAGYHIPQFKPQYFRWKYHGMQQARLWNRTESY